MADEEEQWGDSVDAFVQKQMAEDYRNQFVYWSKLAVKSYTLKDKPDLSISDQWDQFFDQVMAKWEEIPVLLDEFFNEALREEWNQYSLEDIRHFEFNSIQKLERKFRRKFFRISTLQFVLKLKKKTGDSLKNRTNWNFQRKGLFLFKFDNSDVSAWLQDFEFVNNLPYAFTTHTQKKRFRLPLVCWFNPKEVPDDQRDTKLYQNRLEKFNSIFEQFKSKWNLEAYKEDDTLTDKQLQFIFRQRASAAWFDIVYALTKTSMTDRGEHIVNTRPDEEFQYICRKHGISHHYTINELRAGNWPELDDDTSKTCVLGKHMSNPYLITQ